MLKKNEIKMEAITKESLTLENEMAKYKNVSLRKIATELDISYPALLKASKAPKAGEAYDPDAVNYDAIALEILKREKSCGELDWKTLNETGTKDAKVIKDSEAFQVGMKVYLRKEPTTPYTIVYRTSTHIVFQLEGTEEPICWKINTFMLNGPQLTPRAERKVAEEK